MRQLPLLTACAVLVMAAVLFRARLREVFFAFWYGSGSAFTLAFFRIVLFITFFRSVDVPATVWYSQMPNELRFPPFGLDSVLAHLPVNPALARSSAAGLLICCVLAAAGICTRVAVWLTVLLGLYVLGLPHLYGKVNHLHHHLIWFAALLAVSPCADVLSGDAIARAWRKTNYPNTIADSRRYALPLRFVWLLMGVIYFFPGCWKLWSVGLPWASADNMQLQMYSKWLEFDGWTPAFRIDHFPALCVVGGIATILFEVSFLFLVFFARLRPFLIPAGLAFHNVTNSFMRISFVPLQPMYASFVDWGSVFRWIGRRLFPKPVRITCNGHPRRRRLIASLRALDIFDRIEYVDNAANSQPVHPIAASSRGAGTSAMIVVGTVLLAMNIGLGLGRISEAWPFACYPTFAFRATAQRPVLALAAGTENGSTTKLKWNELSPYFAPDHARGLQESLLRIKDFRALRPRLEALWKLWRRDHPELRDTRSVSFYKETLSTIPEQSHLNPLRRELIATLSTND